MAGNMFMPNQIQNQIMLVPIQGESWAQMYPVAAGTTVALIDFEGGFFWLKNAAQTRKFKFEEIAQAQANDGTAALRSEIDELKKMVAALAGGKQNDPTGNA